MFFYGKKPPEKNLKRQYKNLHLINGDDNKQNNIKAKKLRGKVWFTEGRNEIIDWFKVV